MVSTEHSARSKIPLRCSTHINIHNYAVQPSEPETSKVLAPTREDSMGTIESGVMFGGTNTHLTAHSINHRGSFHEINEGIIDSSQDIHLNAANDHQETSEEASSARTESDGISRRYLSEAPENPASVDAASLEVNGIPSQTEQHVHSDTTNRDTLQLDWHPTQDISVADVEALAHVVRTLAQNLDSFNYTPSPNESSCGSDAQPSSGSIPRATSFGDQVSVDCSMSSGDCRSDSVGTFDQTPTWQCLECSSQNCATRTIIDTVSIKAQHSRMVRTTTICRECYTQSQFRSCLQCSTLNHGARTVCFHCLSSLVDGTGTTPIAPHQIRRNSGCDDYDFDNLGNDTVRWKCSTRHPSCEIGSEATPNPSPPELPSSTCCPASDVFPENPPTDSQNSMGKKKGQDSPEAMPLENDPNYLTSNTVCSDYSTHRPGRDIRSQAASHDSSSEDFASPDCLLRHAPRREKRIRWRVKKQARKIAEAQLRSQQ
ncbi:hypothetical protein BJ875DRAFT_456163 [Amylocarpus encephaloides]|uniref:Uncharacterized protein n=1 Tax=Amylocarpus encephaloides TaxID=45428 RepID=A0A9P8C7B2_9HELO|nr:hypothetical protein BJ875DRAFT_456163 [Amylocarpus encephaloides]